MKILVVVIGVLALVLNYVSSLQNVETAILGLSFAVVILSGLLIGVIIPIAAVYELWSGAKREKKCSRMFKMLKARRNLRRNNLKFKRNVLNSAKSSVIEKLTDLVGSSMGDADPEEMFLLLQLLETEEHQTPIDSNNVDSNNVDGENVDGGHDVDGQRKDSSSEEMFLFRSGRVSTCEKELEMVSIAFTSFSHTNPMTKRQKITKKDITKKDISKKDITKKDLNKRGRAPGWEIARDESSGQEYFFSRGLSRSVWSVEETWKTNEQQQKCEDENEKEQQKSEKQKIQKCEDENEKEKKQHEQKCEDENEKEQKSKEETPIERVTVMESTDTTTASNSVLNKTKKTKKKKKKKRDQKRKLVTNKGSFELEGIRLRILESISAKQAKDGTYHVRKTSMDSADQGDQGRGEGCAIEISDVRGCWLMVYDELLGMTCYYNQENGELLRERPKGWVKMLAEERFGGK